MYTIMFSAGEASGDAHAANALLAFKETNGNVNCFGMGASHLEAAGTELIINFTDLTVIGFVDVLLNYHKFLKRLKILRKAMVERKPDLLVLVDVPDFNLKLAETAQELGIPVLFYVSPSIWAWRAKRIKRIGALVDHMAVLFPFEVKYYEDENIPVTYVGNPLVDDAVSPYTQADAKEHFGLNPSAVTIGILPGSRQGELQRILPPMLNAAMKLNDQYSSVQFLLPKADTLTTEDLDAILSQHSIDPTIIEGESCNVMRASDVLMCASGTATLEAALIGTPTVLVYKLSRINYEIMRRLIKIKNIGLVNIVAGRQIVPELIQADATGDRISEEVSRLLDDPAAALTMVNEMQVVKEKMGSGGASARVGALIATMLAKEPDLSGKRDPLD